jgi:membrane protease YdiL (CAAX protease family)
MEKLKNLFYKIHNDYFKWYDLLLITIILLLGWAIVGANVGYVITDPLYNFLLKYDESFTKVFIRYSETIGYWILLIVYLLIFKAERPILKTFLPKYKGNTVKFFLIGLLVGGGMNVFCAIVAMLNKDIALYYNQFPFVKVFLVFLAVFIQSGSEEILCRGFFYQRMRRAFRNPWVSVIGNALLFGALHLGNKGVTALGVINIILFGIFMSLIIYYYESMWMAIAVHTAWNFSQSIVLGLPNSGIVFDFSVFKLDAASARNSFAYHVNFGIEGTIFSTVLIAVVIVILLVLNKKRQGDNLWILGETVFIKQKKKKEEKQAEQVEQIAEASTEANADCE